MQEIADIVKVLPLDEDESDSLPPLSLDTTGFSSPAEHYLEAGINLNRELIRNPLTTYYMRVITDVMSGIGILKNATLIVDKAHDPKIGNTFVFRVGDEYWVRQFLIDGENRVWLMPKNENYQPFEVTSDLDFEPIGKVIWSINKH